MSETFMKHFVALCGSLVCLIIFWVGYVGGANGLWLPVIGIAAIYGMIYKLLDL